ncbi:MAG: hypothetical protein E7292_00365 [Lachnospiraceae bacterium]|nr:hypothetical protein [Lachnospiraceae bacterium]
MKKKAKNLKNGNKSKQFKVNKIVRLCSGLLVMTVMSCALWQGGIFSQAAPAEVSLQPGNAARTASVAQVTDKELAELAAERDMMALIYLCKEYEVKANPEENASAVAVVSSGQTVFILDALYNQTEGKLWIQVSFDKGEGSCTGYVERSYLACSDERFLQWETEFARSNHLQSTTDVSLLAESDNGVSADIAQFPESYHTGLSALKKAHPQWVFVPMETGLDWNTVITEELKGGRSLVYKSFPNYTKEGAYDDGNWFYASREILEYYMDPRNAMTDNRIFQFELLTYNETYHTEAAVESFLSNTFMKSDTNAPGTVMTYAHIFWAIGAEEGREVSPFHLASRVYQEQGQGTSPLISGTYPGYEGYYNHFNVGASGKTTEEVIVNGLKYAKEKNWYNAYFSILGGADTIAANYIKKGQDTLYLQKYNVNPNASNALYTHQYMQNISAPTTEASSIKKLYESAKSLENSFVFKIPVYKNMPETACPYPENSTNVILQVPSGYDSTVWVGGIPYEAENRNSRQIVKAIDDKATDAVVYSYNSEGIPTGMYVWTLNYENSAYTVTAQPDLRDLLSYHGFSIRISGDPGIRLKTGISKDLKNTLINSGVNGYKLKEYGTLVTDKTDLTANPLVKGGEGVMTGVSYGTDSSGNKLDMVFETVDGRQRFTSVLVGLPITAYKTEYSFRGYVVLEKSGKETVIYGPVRARSMTGLAKQVLDSGAYENGSAEDSFLRKLLEDAQ